MLWVLRTGAPWKDLPSRCGDDATCHRRFQMWVRDGALEAIRRALLQDLADRGKVKREEGFVEATFVAAKKGGSCVGPTKRGKGTKLMAVVDGNGVPLSFSVHSASPAEKTLLEETLDVTPEGFIPENLIGDRAYDDDDKLDNRVRDTFGVKLIAPNRVNRRQSQDGRALRRYKRRWKVERLFAWLGKWRSLVVRYEVTRSPKVHLRGTAAARWDAS